MPNSIITHTPEIEKTYFNPVLYLNYDEYDGSFQNLYIFIAKSDPWANIIPTEFVNTQKNVKDLFKNIIAIKKLNVSDISPVIEKITWKANTYYDIYTDIEDMFVRDSNKKLIKKFYVKNRFDQIFKCLWNNKNTSNTYTISNIITANNYKSITHSGGTFDIGSYVTIDTVDSSDYNGTYKIIDSSLGLANVAFGNSGSYIITTNSAYTSGGTIKYSVLSSEEPVFDVGTFDKNDVVKTSDGYKWKYIYTIDPGTKLKFSDDEWITIPVQIDNQNPYYSDAKFGCIDVINIVDGGTGYTDGVGTVDLFIDGDGESAVGDVYVSGGKISDILLSDYGSNYTYANVIIQPAYGYAGSGAQITHSISPIGGHGFNYMKEFDCRDVMISCTIEQDDNIPTDITFHQVGILCNPFTYESATSHANTSFYSLMTSFVLSAGLNEYSQGETIYQGSSLETATFSGTVVSFDNINNMLYVINTTGTPQTNYSLFGEISSTNRIITQINTPGIIIYSGTIYHLENKVGIERHPLGSEQVRILISY